MVSAQPIWLARVTLALGCLMLSGVAEGHRPTTPALFTNVEADVAPSILDVSPPPETTGVPLDAALSLTFSEPVALAADALTLTCELSGAHATTSGGGDERFTLTPTAPFQPGEWCAAVLRNTGVTDLDADDPPDSPPDSATWRFRAAAAPVWINEVEALSADGVVEYLELYDGGAGRTDLRGLVLVRYLDSVGVTYARALDGYRTDSRGYFVIGTRATPGVDLIIADGAWPDQPAALTLYDAPRERFPGYAPPSTEGLVEAAVYGAVGAELLALLEPGQMPLDEGERGAATADSVGRCPNGSGKRRETATFTAAAPTPDETNDCGPIDAAPSVLNTVPADGATRVVRHAALEIIFSEPVRLSETPVALSCGLKLRTYTVEGAGDTYRILPNPPLPGDTACAVTLRAGNVSDVDENDPPDQMAQDFIWGFTTAVAADEGC